MIAERKSVVFHLRELAKASVLAKFLMEQEVEMDDSGFNPAEDPEEAGIVIGFAQDLDYDLSPAESGRDDYYGLSPAESGMDDDYAYPRQCRRRMK